jgi:outer membrane protein assembly factor BamD
MRRWLFLSSIVLITFSSCSSYQKVLKSSDYNLKHTKALEYYEKKDYQRAFPLLEELVSVYRATAKAEDIYFYYAYCHYHMDDLISAGYHFSQFAKSYPTSKRAEEASFMNAYCYYRGSPNYSLDQRNTIRAIEELQLYLNQYPSSSRVDECNQLIDKLRMKLEKKSFESAMLYYKTLDYKGAIVALKNVIKDYPNTLYKEEVMFTLVKANFYLAENSIDSKKSERYKQTIDAYYVFIDKFATGKYTREAESIYVKARQKYDQLKPLNG